MRSNIFLAGAVSAVFGLPLAPGSAGAQQPSQEQTHASLREFRTQLGNAFNSRDRAELLKAVTPDVVFVAINNDYVKGREQLGQYYDRMLVGSAKWFDAVTLDLASDDLSTILPGGEAATTSGTAGARFQLVGGKIYDWPLRWTATVVRQGGGWAIQSLHFSGNVLDNPLMAAETGLARWLVGAAGVVGLIIGFLVGRISGRSRTAAEMRT